MQVQSDMSKKNVEISIHLATEIVTKKFRVGTLVSDVEVKLRSVYNLTGGGLEDDGVQCMDDETLEDSGMYHFIGGLMITPTAAPVVPAMATLPEPVLTPAPAPLPVSAPAQPKLERLKSTSHRDSDFRAALINCAKVVGSLLKCAYSVTYALPRNSQWAKDMLKAVVLRQHHRDADADLALYTALQSYYWLPLRVACVYSYSPSKPLLIPRIEYEAVAQFSSQYPSDMPGIVALCLQELHTLPITTSSIELSISIAHKQSCDETVNCKHLESMVLWNKRDHRNPPVRSVCGDGCPKLNLLDSYMTVPVCGYRHAKSYDMHLSVDQVLSTDPTEWDPMIWSNAVKKWFLYDQNGSRFFYFERNHLTKSFYGIEEFPVVPQELQRILSAISGNQTTQAKVDIRRAVEYILAIRNFNFHSGDHTPYTEVWRALSGAIKLCFVASQQAANWRLASLPPPSNLLDDLDTEASDALGRLYDILPRYGPQFSRSCGRDFDTFSTLFNGFNPSECPISILMAPPLGIEGIPGDLAAIPWTCVVDMCDVSLPGNCLSPLWQTFSHTVKNGLVHTRKFEPIPLRTREDVNNISLRIELFDPKESSDLPWFQPLLEPSGDSIKALFDPLTGTDVDDASIMRVEEQLNRIAYHLKEKAEQSLKDVVLVVPMYGVYSRPFRPHGASGNSFAFSSNIEDVHAKNTLNYNFAHFARCMINYLSNSPNVRTRIIVLTDGDMNSDLESWVKESVATRINRNGNIFSLGIPPHVFNHMYETRVKFVESFSESVCVLSGSEENQLLPYPLSKRLFRDSGIDFADISYEHESRENWYILSTAGLELLHTRLSADSLQKKQGLMNGSLIGVEEKEKIMSPLDRLIIEFAVGQRPSWALYDKSILRSHNIERVMVDRDGSAGMTELESKGRSLWEHAQQHVCVTTLYVTHGRRHGATTLARKFVWDIAFWKWGAVVFDVSGIETRSLPSPDALSAVELCQRVSSLPDLNQLKPIVLLADRTVSSEKLKALTDSLCGKHRKVPVLVVRLQREKIDRQSESTGTVEIKAPTKDDFAALENILREITRDSDLKLSDAFKGKNGYSFRPLIGYLEFGGQISDSSSGKIYWDMYQSVVQDWVDVILADLYKIAKDEPARRPVLRAMMCAALTQLCELDCKGFSVDSFRPILEDTSSQQWLLDGCQLIEGKDLLPIEDILLKEAYHTLDSEIRKDPNDEEYVERSGVITPFREIIDGIIFCESGPTSRSMLDTVDNVLSIINTKFEKVKPEFSNPPSGAKSTKLNVLAEFMFSLTCSAASGEDDRVWSDLLISRDDEGSFQFVNNDVARRFLDCALSHEELMAKESGYLTDAPPTYILVLKLLHSFHRSAATRKIVKIAASAKDRESDVRIAVRFLQVFTSHQYNIIDKNSNADNGRLEEFSGNSFSFAINKIFKEHAIDLGSGPIFSSKALRVLFCALPLYPFYWDLSRDISRFMMMIMRDYRVKALALLNSGLQTSKNFSLNNSDIINTILHRTGVLYCTSVGYLLWSRRGFLGDKRLCGTYDMLGNNMRCAMGMSAVMCLKEMQLTMYELANGSPKKALDKLPLNGSEHKAGDQLSTDSSETDTVSVTESRAGFQILHRDLAPNVVFDILKEYSVELLVLANHAQVWYDESLNYVTDNEVGTTIADTAEMLVIALEGIMHMFNEARANASIDMLVQWEKCYQQFCEHDFFVAVKEAMTAIKGGRITLWSKSAMVATGEINFSFRLRNRMITSCEIALSVASEKLDKLRNVNMHDEKVDKSRGILDGRELSLFKRILAIEAGPFQNVTTYVTYRRAWMKIFKSELSHLQSFEPSKKALKSMKIARIAEYFISSPNSESFDAESGRPSTLSRHDIIIGHDFNGYIESVVKPVVDCICDCVVELEYPASLMNQLLEFSAFTILCENPDNRKYVHDIEPFFREWFSNVRHAKTKSSAESVTIRAAYLDYAALAFVKLWGATNYADEHNSGNRGDTDGSDSIIEEINGTYRNGEWVEGELGKLRPNSTSRPEYLYVLTEPAVIEASKGKPFFPVSIRRYFGDINEAKSEAVDSSTLKKQALVRGHVVHIAPKYPNSTIREGVVQVEGYRVYLPFTIGGNRERTVLEMAEMYPKLNHPCTFHVRFCRYSIIATGVQLVHESIERISLKRMLRDQTGIDEEQKKVLKRTSLHVPYYIPAGQSYASASFSVTLPSDINTYHDFSDPAYANVLLRKNGDICPVLRLLVQNEFKWHEIQAQYYGRLTEDNKFLSPYGAKCMPHTTCGIILCPVVDGNRNPLFTWAGRITPDPEVLWMVRDGISSFVTNAIGLRESKPMRQGEKTLLSVGAESVNKSLPFHMNILISLPTWSLVCLREGILITRQSSVKAGDTRVLELGVLMFDNTIEVVAELTDLRKRCVERFLGATNTEFISRKTGISEPSIGDLGRHIVCGSMNYDNPPDPVLEEVNLAIASPYKLTSETDFPSTIGTAAVAAPVHPLMDILDTAAPVQHWQNYQHSAPFFLSGGMSVLNTMNLPPTATAAAGITSTPVKSMKVPFNSAPNTIPSHPPASNTVTVKRSTGKAIGLFLVMVINVKINTNHDDVCKLMSPGVKSVTKVTSKDAKTGLSVHKGCYVVSFDRESQSLQAKIKSGTIFSEGRPILVSSVKPDFWLNPKETVFYIA